MMQGLDSSYGAVLFVSYHGSAGAPAGLSHTYNPRAVSEARLDGVVTGEAGINALVAAHYGVPVVLVTGDRCACEETAAVIPGVHAAMLKEPVSRVAAHSLHLAPAAARRAAADADRERGYVVKIMEEPGDDPQPPARYRYGSAAVDALIARIDQREPGDVMIRGPMSLVPRQSVAGPPAGRADQRGR